MALPNFLKKKKDEELAKKSPVNSRFFDNGDPGTDNLANNYAQYIEFFHLPSSYFVSFKAFLTEFTDNYTSEWNTSQVYGRMDPIATFKRTSRKISVAFEAPAQSIQEAEQNMTRMSLLLQMLYPSYDASALSHMEATQGSGPGQETISTIKGSPLFKIKFLNWIKGSSYETISAESGMSTTEGKIGLDAQSSGLMGFVEGFSFAPDLDAGVFQAGLELWPKLMRINFTFNVIHEHELGWEKTKSTGKGGVIANPSNNFFPYGRDSRFSKQDKSKQEKKQLKRFKELQKAQQKLLTK
tara:strand:- start:2738 stop:3628 length:891 start_codon:yes stop_codon:yes gene_type:complete